MKYDWEKEISESILSDIQEANIDLPDDFVVIGIAVANTANGEACLINDPRFNIKADMCVADFWQDVGGDVEVLRSNAMDFGGTNDN